MTIKELFDRDITRRINPAVVVSEMDTYSINQEIDEYVFTPAITKSIYKFLNAVVNKKEGKTGIWISGYYGSGKSHFIKYLFYCLHSAYSDKAFNHFRESVNELDPLDEPNPGLISTLHNKLTKLTVDEIIFNIDAVSDRKDSKERITRVLLNQLNRFRGYNNSNIALALYLEKPLDKAGLFNKFQERIKEAFNEEWEGNQLRFTMRYLDKVIDIAGEFDPDIDKHSLRSAIIDRNQDYTIEFLISELQDYLAGKSPDHRLLFMIDEVSQYIGSDTTLLLNLQTIVEEIGSRIGARVWVVCTAQQELSKLVDNTENKAEDFGKIFARFETTISLESQDAAFITKKRVLDKNSDGIGVLDEYYRQNKGAVENQFVFDHDLYTNYGAREDFVLTYPFVPYQFRLISDVFESFSNVGYVGEGVKNTERAILGITHFTANLCKDREVGFFVPFDLFFNEQLEKNLSHYARNILDRAYNLREIQKDPFARRVVNALFMVSNLGERHSVNFPATIENIALLMMDALDTPKVEIQQQVQAVLAELVDKNIIQVTEGKYRFLKEDEIEVAQMIKNTPVTGEDRLTYFYEDIILKIIKPDPVVNFGTRGFRMAIQIDDKQITQSGDFNLKFVVYDNSDLDHIAHTTPTNDMAVGICDWFKHDNDFKVKVLEYVKTQKYIRLNSSTATGSRMQTLANFREANKLLLREIHSRFEKMFMQTGFVSKNQVIGAEELNTSAPGSRFQQMVMRHMEEVYNKHRLCSDYAASSAALITNARSKQTQLHKELKPAEEEVNIRLNLEGESPVAGDIVKFFGKPPYGWKDTSTLDVLLQLAKKGLRRFEWRGEEISPETFAEKAINTRERDAITILKEKVHSREQVGSFIHTVNNEIFLENLIPAGSSEFKEVMVTFKKKLEPIILRVNQLKDEYESRTFSIHLKNYHKSLSELYQARNNDEVMELVFSSKLRLKALRDNFAILEEFINTHIADFDQINRFAEMNKNNFDALDELQQVKAGELSSYLKTDHEPWEKYPQMKRAYKELHTAIAGHINALRAGVLSLYEGIFAEIAQRAKELGVDDANVTTDPSVILQKIKKENQIAQLEIFELKANEFRAKNFKLLDDHKARQTAKKTGGEYEPSIPVSLAAEMPPTTIETPEQLDEYLKKLRERLMIKLAKSKKLFIN